MPYTHDFELKSNSHTISGEVEFNTDGKMSYNPSAGVAMELTESKAFHDLLAAWKEVFDAFGGIDKIELTSRA